MGYDCTYHLVDEKAIREEFVPKLLGELTGETRFDQVRENAAELWTTVRRALVEGVNNDGDELDAEEVASLVCQLAVMYSACSLPHHYERGLALSLWPEDAGDALPSELAESPESLFTAVVAKHPHLQGRFPNWFTGNYCTGVFVGAPRVAKVRAWVEKAIAKLDKGRQRDFRGLVAVLKTAEAKGLAYWEATDLAIPMLNQVPGDPNLMTADFLRKLIDGEGGADKFRLPRDERFDHQGGAGNIHVLSHARPHSTLILDVRHWPPTVHVRENEYARNADVDAKGRWVFATVIDDQPTLGQMLLDPKGQATQGLAIEDGKKDSIDFAYLVAGRMVLVPNTSPRADAIGTQEYAWIQEGDKAIRAPGLPAHTVTKDRMGNKWIIHDVARLTDGTEVFYWEGNGYEWDGTTFRMTFPVGFTDPYDDLNAIPVGADGFFCVSGRKLFEVHRGQPPVQRAEKWTNIMAIQPGPRNGLLLKEGQNKDGDLGKLYFPDDDTFIHIEPELLGDQKLYDFLCWSPDADRIIASDSYSLYAVPTQTLLDLPRRSMKTGRKVK